jgi:hypothetical protein
MWIEHCFEQENSNGTIWLKLYITFSIYNPKTIRW